MREDYITGISWKWDDIVYMNNIPNSMYIGSACNSLENELKHE